MWLLKGASKKRIFALGLNTYCFLKFLVQLAASHHYFWEVMKNCCLFESQRNKIYSCRIFECHFNSFYQSMCARFLAAQISCQPPAENLN